MGYIKDIVNIPDVGKFLGIHIDTTKEECANLCFGLSDCVSFEHSLKERRCNLNPMGQLQGSVNGYLFCYNTRMCESLVLNYV